MSHCHGPTVACTGPWQWPRGLHGGLYATSLTQCSAMCSDRGFGGAAAAAAAAGAGPPGARAIVAMGACGTLWETESVSTRSAGRLSGSDVARRRPRHPPPSWHASGGATNPSSDESSNSAGTSTSDRFSSPVGRISDEDDAETSPTRGGGSLKGSMPSAPKPTQGPVLGLE